MLSSQALALKSSTGLPNFTCLEGESLILCYSTSFLQTSLVWPGGLSPCGCWFHVDHFTSLLGPGESSLLHISMGIYKQPKFPPAAQNGFSAGCDHCSLLCVSPGAAAACSQEHWTTKCMLQCCQEGGLHSFPLETSSVVAGRAGVKRCPLFCLCWLESLASHLAQAVLSPSRPSLGKALQYPGILTILNRLGATYGAKWLDYKKSNHICCPGLIFVSIRDQAFCSITNILHAAEIKLLCSSLHFVPTGIVSILMFGCRNLMNKLTLHLIKSATFVINCHSGLLFVAVVFTLYRRRNTKRTHTYVSEGEK